MYRLWLRDKLMMSELAHLTLTDVDAMNRALDVWDDAQAEANPRGGR